MKFEETLL